MGKPVATMIGTHDATGPLRGRAEAAAVRGATARMRFLISAQPDSMGLKSYEYGGKKRTVAPACSIASRTARVLCAARLSSTTMSPRRSRGTRRR